MRNTEIMGNLWKNRTLVNSSSLGIIENSEKITSRVLNEISVYIEKQV